MQRQHRDSIKGSVATTSEDPERGEDLVMETAPAPSTGAATHPSVDPEKGEAAGPDPLPDSARDSYDNRANLIADLSIIPPLFVGTPIVMILYERGHDFCSEAWPAFLLGLVVAGFCFPAFCVYMSLLGKYEDRFPKFPVFHLSVPFFLLRCAFVHMVSATSCAKRE